MKTILLITLAPTLTFAQSTISEVDHHAYAANAGWIDFRPDETNGVRITESFLSGYAYAANFGWINFGDGSPDNGYAYTNDSATDSGVNLTDSGELSGYAYSANAGWIHFERDQGNPILNFNTGQLSGYTYSANLGWISLATASSTLATTTLPSADTDHDGIADAYEMRYFGNLKRAGLASDSDADGQSDLSEYIAGTDPKSADSQLKIISFVIDRPASTFECYFTTVPNRLYRIEHDDDLAGIWTDSEAGLFAPYAGDTTYNLIHFPPSEHCFFRIVAVKPLQP